LLTQLRTNDEKFFSVDSIPKPFDLLVAVVAVQRATKDDFAVNGIAQQFPPRQLCRSRFPIKLSGLISAVTTRIFGYIAATLLIGTNGLRLAWATMTTFRGVAEDGHGIIAHFRSLRVAGSSACPTYGVNISFILDAGFI
jgi:hypothetical protein